MAGTAATPQLGETSSRTTWLVCQGVTRRVCNGVVACPIRGRVAVAACLACHLLQAVEDEWRGTVCEVAGFGP